VESRGAGGVRGAGGADPVIDSPGHHGLRGSLKANLTFSFSAGRLAGRGLYTNSFNPIQHIVLDLHEPTGWGHMAPTVHFIFGPLKLK
jgi:hypothetical protein